MDEFIAAILAAYDLTLDGATSPPSHTAVQLSSGNYFDFMSPDPAVITLDVLALPLSRIPRFNGHTLIHFTVSDHCQRVDAIVQLLDERGVIPAGIYRDELRAEALLHDAPEAVMPWGDCATPGKTADMRAAEAAAMAAIRTALGLSDPPLAIVEAVKIADAIALHIEARAGLPPQKWSAAVMWHVVCGCEIVRPSDEDIIAIVMDPKATRVHATRLWRVRVEDMLASIGARRGK